MAALMCCVSIAGVAAHPEYQGGAELPRGNGASDIGDWTIVAEKGSQIIDPGTDELLKKISKETMSRTYVNKAGYKVMLSMARSGNQIGIQRAHHLEICSPTQGFHVDRSKTASW